MKQLFRSLMFVAAAAGLFTGCSKTDNEDTSLPAAPSMVWAGNDLEAVHEITDQMSVKIDMLIPGNLQKLELEIDSPALSAEMLGMVGLATKMELTNPATSAMGEMLKTLGLPAGKEIVGSQKLVFNISTLVPMIKAIYKEDSEHRFKVTITDASNQSITKTLRFHLGAGAPEMIWEGQDLEALHEITDEMSIKIDMLVPGKLQKLELEIDSPALSAEMLGMVGLATKMELTNPATSAMGEMLKTLGLPAGKEIVGSQKLVFNISTLVPMIKAIYQETSEHRFKVTITDSFGQILSKTLRFHLTGPTTVDYNNDANLWKNTATLSAVVRVEGEVKIEYRKKGAAVWQAATVTKGGGNAYQATIAPTWKAEGKHATGVDQFSLDSNTGIFAGNTYEYRLTVAGTEMDKKEFKAADGQKIPGGDMNSWKKAIVKDGSNEDVEIDVATAADGSDFWGSGNNFMTPTLCTPEVLNGSNRVAKLKGLAAFGAIFAAGNFFSGKFVFDYEAYNGYAHFGQKYTFSARPTALKLRYKATIGTVGFEGLKAGVIKKGDVDRGRIFVCITDWTAPHAVMSGMGAMMDPTAINAFDPEADAKTEEGKILAYGVKWISETVGQWTELTIPLLYNEKDSTAPATDKYSFVLSAAASAYGDYLCGGLDNELYLDDIQWVY